MGAIVTKLQIDSAKAISKALPSLTSCKCGNMWIVSIEKVKKLHGIFKSICEGFSINQADYAQLFEKDQETFSVWDTERTCISLCDFSSHRCLRTLCRTLSLCRCKN